MWTDSLKIPLLTDHFMSRYVKINPSKLEDYLSFLLEHRMIQKAADLYVQILNSSTNNNLHEFWMQACELISKHPEIQLNSEQIIR